MSDPLDLNRKFTLEDTITEEQARFMDVHGFLHFKQVLTPDEVKTINDEADRIEREWLDEGRRSVFGIPLFIGDDAERGHRIQRLCFTSVFSPSISEIVRDGRFRPLLSLVGDDARVGEREKDGVVINTNINQPGSAYPRLGWHTDGLRDLFYLRMPQQMLNFGLHLTDCPKENGGLRLIPGTHKQGFWSMAFGKAHFVDHRVDKNEIAVETQAGDMTVHDGRLWHRVQQSPHVGAASFRRTMYVPYQTGPYEPKSDQSRTPAYHHFGRALRALRVRTQKLKAALAG